MKTISSTPVLYLLVKKALLRHRLELLNLYNEKVLDFLTRLYREIDLPIYDSFKNLPINRLQEYGLISIEDQPQKLSKKQKIVRKKELLSLALACAINFELTYRCNMECSHCLQKKLRSSKNDKELAVTAIKDAIYDAWFSGLIMEKSSTAESGVNFTGGEVLFKYTKIFELIDYAKSLNLGVRLNSNSWWGNKKTFTAGGRRFKSPSHLVGTLKERGLTVFAFSFDERFDHDKHAFKRLAGTVRACEQNGFPYQIVCTGRTNSQIEKLYSKLEDVLGIELDNFIPVKMEKVDIGGAADQCISGNGRKVDLCMLTEKAECELKGFYHPLFLHVDPFGGVRSCLSAPGLSNMGNLSKNSLIEIINRFPSDPVSSAFREKKLNDYSEKLYVPYANLYKRFKHPCTASTLLAKLIEAATLFEQKKGRAPEQNELKRINLRIAREMNLTRVV